MPATIPAREGLRETPKRVVSAYDEFFAGYHECPLDVLSRTFDEVAGYDDIVMLRDIELHSHCEHHMIPFIGKAHVAYFPTDRVVGISKLARVVEVFARRLQTQETMTAQIAETIDKALKPKGVAVMIEAVHQCMSIRGVKKPNVATITTQFTGIFKEDPAQQARFMMLATERGRLLTRAAREESIAVTKPKASPPPAKTADIEEGTAFAPKFDADGLVAGGRHLGRNRRGVDARLYERRGPRPHASRPAKRNSGRGRESACGARARRAATPCAWWRCARIATRMRSG